MIFSTNYARLRPNLFLLRLSRFLLSNSPEILLNRLGSLFGAGFLALVSSRLILGLVASHRGGVLRGLVACWLRGLGSLARARVRAPLVDYSCIIN